MMRFIILTLLAASFFFHRSSAQEERTSYAPYLHNQCIAFSISLSSILSPEFYNPFYNEVVLPLSPVDELHAGYLFTLSTQLDERLLGFDLKYYRYFGVDKYTSAFVDGFIETSTSIPSSLRLHEIPAAIQVRNSNIATGVGFGIAYFPASFLQLACEERIVFARTKTTNTKVSRTLGSEIRFFVRVKFW